MVWFLYFVYFVQMAKYRTQVSLSLSSSSKSIAYQTFMYINELSTYSSLLAFVQCYSYDWSHFS